MSLPENISQYRNCSHFCELVVTQCFFTFSEHIKLHQWIFMQFCCCYSWSRASESCRKTLLLSPSSLAAGVCPSAFGIVCWKGRSHPLLLVREPWWRCSRSKYSWWMCTRVQKPNFPHSPEKDAAVMKAAIKHLHWPDCWGPQTLATQTLHNQEVLYNSQS